MAAALALSQQQIVSSVGRLLLGAAHSARQDRVARKLVTNGIRGLSLQNPRVGPGSSDDSARAPSSLARRPDQTRACLQRAPGFRSSHAVPCALHRGRTFEAGCFEGSSFEGGSGSGLGTGPSPASSSFLSHIGGSSRHFRTGKVARGRQGAGKSRGGNVSADAPRRPAPVASSSRRGRQVEAGEAGRAEEEASRGSPARVTGPRTGDKRKKHPQLNPGPSREGPVNGSLKGEASDGGAIAGEAEGEGEFEEYTDFGILTRSMRQGQFVQDNESVQDAPFMDAVVKVYCTHTEPNFSLPWQKRRQSHSTGSGFMISGRRLLTNAHCVDHHTQVKVKRRGDDTKFLAKVLAIGVECDIALLSVDDDAFWEGHSPLRFGGLPNLQDAVTVVGYPIGGDTISVTSGVVSRIEVMSYVHGATELLGVQIDAAVNPGNSGGPTFNDAGECVGIAFQGLSSSDAENIGYIIPTPVIFHFLEDYKRNGKYTGFPTVGIYYQVLESPTMRTCLKMQADQKGVFICRVEPTAPSNKVLKSGDVLLKFDGVPVANDGTVVFRKGERVSYKFLVCQKFSGESANLEILRDGAVMQVSVELRPAKKLVPVHIEGRPPSYFIAAGLVFTPVVEPFLASEYGQDYEYETPVDVLQKLLNDMAQHDDQELVVLCQVLANECSIGFEAIRNSIVKSVNGTNIRNLRQLAQLVDSCTEEFMRFEVGRSMLVVLETKKLKDATQQVLADHSIPFDRSVDLRTPDAPVTSIVEAKEAKAEGEGDDKMDVATTPGVQA